VCRESVYSARGYANRYSPPLLPTNEGEGNSGPGKMASVRFGAAGPQDRDRRYRLGGYRIRYDRRDSVAAVSGRFSFPVGQTKRSRGLRPIFRTSMSFGGNPRARETNKADKNRENRRPIYFGRKSAAGRLCTVSVVSLDTVAVACLRRRP